MTQTPGREQLTDLLAEQWEAIALLVADLDEKAWRRMSPLPGWTLFDVVAHVVGSESWLLGETPPPHDPLRPKDDVRTLPHVRNEVAVLNEIWVDRLRPLSGKRLLALFDETTERRRAALAAMDDEDWQASTVSPVGQVPYGRFMRVRLFDCWMHELDLADGIGRSVPEGGARAEAAFAELTIGLGRAVVKGAKAPDGSLITLDLTGPVTRQVHLSVAGGRGTVLDEISEQPTTVLRLDSGLFARLRGGRTTADRHPGEVVVEGDTALGERLVRNLAFTI
ncbi:maleylpyruvate isomerase N-terminal domain-containing protein [Nocardia salmonicida]|uniref:maleylpyruvate isomerase N-terminal domain-containing protein n=1 Tax=Nocardia TaxID=1817 RepID=UPI002659D41A|nr:maleylpyruvate isomerase N-terminal domain-containing protein [Nocardia sp. PE-7]WKG10566.1 maleylpyruvate isomerase N-terminal domain-containing protein [Nocardia sp. PE-7]